MELGNDKQKLLIENLPDAFAYNQVITADDGSSVDCIFLEVNAAFEKMTGLKRKEIIGKKGTEVLSGTEMSESDWICTCGQVALSGEPFRFEHYYKSSGRWYDVCAYSDEPGYFAVVFRDITVQKFNELNLQRSEYSYKYLTNNIPEMVVHFDTELRHIYGNQVVEKTLGIPADFFKGKTFLDLQEWSISEEQANQLQTMHETLQRCLQSGVEQHFYDSFMLPEGEKHLLTRIVPEKGKDGQIVTLLAVTTDITEHKKAEEALQESEEKHRRLFETMAQGVIYQAADGKIISANPAAERILGITLDQIQGKTSMDPHWQMINEDGTPVPGTDHPTMIALRTGQKVGPVTRGIFHPDTNNHIWLNITAIPLFQPGQEEPFQAYATFEDITERKQAEENLEQEQKEKELILNNLAEQVAFIDPDMRIVWANSKVIERHNIGNVEYKGQKCYEAYHQLSEPCPDCPIIDVFKTGTAAEGVHRAPDGLYWNVTGKPVFDEGGKMVGVLDTALDISDLIVAQQELQEREDRFQRMLRVIPDMISVQDTDMNIVYSNWTGFAAVPPEKQVLNTKCYKTYRDYDQVCPDCRAIQVFDSKETFQQEVELAEDYWIDLRVIPILDSSGEVEYFIEWVRDISSLKAIEEELKILNVNLEQKVEERTAQLKVANRELDAFTHSASHDLRSPLNRISGFSQAILEDCSDQLDSQSRDYLQRINGSCEHMKSLIDDLLKLSQVSQMQISCEPVEISALVNVCLKELKAREPDRQVETVVTPGLIAEGDTALLRIALENLLGNAWKYTVNEEVARIEFGSILQEGKEIFYIRDNGTGFNMKHADKLFDPFQRLHNAKSYPGTGIGLSIVSRIVHRHDREIWAEGEPGKGACFYFTLS